jgi:hypothetical protein
MVQSADSVLPIHHTAWTCCQATSTFIDHWISAFKEDASDMKIRSKAEVCRTLQAVSPDLFSARNEMWCVSLTCLNLSGHYLEKQFFYFLSLWICMSK